MKKWTIKEAEEKLFQIEEKDHPFIKSLEQDNRKGIQKLLEKWFRQYENKQKAKEKFLEMTSFERNLRDKGYKRIAGIDEVGRGPIAGPVVAASVILPESFRLIGIDDSKKLTEETRERYYDIICEQAISIGIGIAEAEEIDQINILEATKKAMERSIQRLTVQPDFLLIDAVKLATPYPYESIIKGDSKSVSIAAASIIAKVTRDRLMKKEGEKYPHYYFEKNVGYGTKEHIEAIKKYGITPIHRKSFAPVKDFLVEEGRNVYDLIR